MSVPIHNSQGVLVGVGMFATELTRFSELVKVTSLGKTGFAYVLERAKPGGSPSKPGYVFTRF